MLGESRICSNAPTRCHVDFVEIRRTRGLSHRKRLLRVTNLPHGELGGPLANQAPEPYPAIMAVGAKAAMSGLVVCLVAAVLFLNGPHEPGVPLSSEGGAVPGADPAPVHLAVGELDAEPLRRILAAPPGPVDGRVIDCQPPTPEQRRKYGLLVQALRNDDIPGNAVTALEALNSEPDAAGLLHETLHSSDLQQRQLAAWLLRRLPVRSTERLAAVSVEALHTEVDNQLYDTTVVSLERSATRYLYHHPEHSRQPLRIALHSADKQQRFMAAFLLGVSGATEDAPTIVRELAPHLADNDIDGDALLATHGLFRLGKLGGQLLEHWRYGLDAQGRQLIDLIQLNLRSPPRNQRELESRRKLHSVTSICFDPTIDYNVRSAHWGQIR